MRFKGKAIYVLFHELKFDSYDSLNYISFKLSRFSLNDFWFIFLTFFVHTTEFSLNSLNLICARVVLTKKIVYLGVFKTVDELS